MTTGPPVVFDLDGTLVLSEHVHRRTWSRFFDDWGAVVDDDVYRRRFMGRRAADVLPEVDGPWRGTPVDVLVASLAEHGAALAGEVEIVPGARELVADLAARGDRIAIVTSAGPDWAGQVVESVLGIGGLVEFVVTGADVARGKPDPEGYLLACARLGVDPADCWACEDSPSGVAALVAAGMGTIVAVCSTATPAELVAAGAHRTVPDLRDLLEPAGQSPVS